MVTLDKQGNPLPGVNVHTVVVPNVYRVREFPAPFGNENDPFFILKVDKNKRPTFFAVLHSTETEAIRVAFGQEQKTPSKFVILTAITLTEAYNLFNRAKGLAF